jgi:hypothetical protein
LTGGNKREGHAISWAITEYVQGEFRTTTRRFNATACGKEGREEINGLRLLSLFTLQLRTDECICVLITKPSAALNKVREPARYVLKLFRTSCNIEEIELGIIEDLGRITPGPDLTDLCPKKIQGVLKPLSAKFFRGLFRRWVRVHASVEFAYQLLLTGMNCLFSR